jgi:hypothetical protein
MIKQTFIPIKKITINLLDIKESRICSFIKKLSKSNKTRHKLNAENKYKAFSPNQKRNSFYRNSERLSISV